MRLVRDVKSCLADRCYVESCLFDRCYARQIFQSVRVGMDERRAVEMSGIVVASAVARPCKVEQQYSSEDGLVAGGCGGLIPGRRPG